jgi:hypothetical protein
LAAVAVAIVAIAAFGTVRAQQWAGPRHHWMGQYAMYGGGMGPGGSWRHHGRSMCGMAQHIDGRLAFLKTEIKITPDQEQLWDAFASTIRDNAQSMQDRCSEMMSQTENKDEQSWPPLPERLDKREQMLEAKLEALRSTNKALKPLYDALSDEQKKSADELIHLRWV